MNNRNFRKPVALAIGVAMAGSLATASAANANPFSLNALGSAYMSAGEGSCGGDKAKEGSCGGDKAKEGSCGGDMAKEGSGGDKAKEGSCGGDKATEGKCGEAKCGADKKN